MKAIISVNKNSAYANLNGHTFEVINLNRCREASIDLSINGTTTTFGFGEVIIVDLQSEMQNYYPKNLYLNPMYVRLKLYCYIKGYQVDVTMNTPV